MDQSFKVNRFNFNAELFNNFQNLHYAKELWPLVYILSDGQTKHAYVGETTDTYSRMSAHLSNNIKNKLTAVHLITSERFNKSATLDIESNLIKYISGDGQYKLLNANVGLANHNYYQKKEYWNLFTEIWQALIAEGVTKHSIESIDNSDLFKYSPYKTLSKDQRKGLQALMSDLLNEEYRNFIVEGGAGTGKSILAIFLFKLLNTDNNDFNFKEFEDNEDEFFKLVNDLKAKYPKPKMALVVPMSSFRKTLKKVFRNIKGLNEKMVVGPTEIVRDQYDIIIVDEAHRLRRRVNLGAVFGAFDKISEQLQLDKHNSSELDWILKQSSKAIFFYDENQSVKPSDVRKEDFLKLKKDRRSTIQILKSQFRVRGGIDYVQYIHNLLHCSLDKKSIYHTADYEFLLFDNVADLVTQIKQRNKEYGLSRLIAGFAWPWISKKDKSKYDIIIEDVKLQWNGVAEDWINSMYAPDEVGCIHTTQGYDLNYAGIIFGKEISYDRNKNEIIINKENYFDKNGKNGIKNIEDLKSYILNIYKTIMLRGIRGTYVYACDPNLRDYLGNHISKFKTEKLSPILAKSEVIPYINAVPLYDLKAAAGGFSEPQIVNQCDWVRIPDRYTPSSDLFACTVVGDSMNKVIPNGSICLFKKYSGGSRNGLIVLAELTEFEDAETGSRYTVKEYRSTKIEEADGFRHSSIILKCNSTLNTYSEITLYEEEFNRLNVIGIFECILH